jgi:Ni/Fe-hydrogenase subunit HybB-like protein
MNRVQNTKTVLWTLTGLAAAVGVTRFIFGLGSTTNLSDATPWGLWIGFDVMGGVALAGGGFVLTAFFYVFKLEKYHSLTRPAVLTAFLGYLAVIFGLLFDVGLPWNLWHMMIYWNLHSPLFEVGWCVMLYTAVLLLEFLPVPLEATGRYAKVRDFLVRFKLPLVLLGIMLSTLHQSSLGSLFLIMPYKLHDLWYSPTLPVQFFISAVALGLMMVSLESLVSHWLYRRKPATDLVAGLAKAAVWVLAVYLVVKIGEIVLAGEFPLIFSGSWESNLFLLEVAVSIIVPMVLFSIPHVRRSPAGQWIGSFLVVFGIVFNRLNVGGVTMIEATGEFYVPSWMEIVISLGVVSTAGLAFLFAVEKLNIWESRPQDPEAAPHSQPAFDYSSRVWLGSPAAAARTKYSLAFVLAFALGFSMMPYSKVEGKGIERIKPQKARGGEVLFVDGNRDGFGTNFKHDMHIKLLGEKESCVKCHHMNMPRDRQSGCWECHDSMYAQADTFNHDWHSGPEGANIGCNDCHREDEERTKETAKKCADCHADLFADADGKATVFESHIAPSYVDAMHRQCIDCHRDRAALDPAKERLTLCPTCHGGMSSDHLKEDARGLLPAVDAKPVIMPPEQSD